MSVDIFYRNRIKLVCHISVLIIYISQRLQIFLKLGSVINRANLKLTVFRKLFLSEYLVSLNSKAGISILSPLLNHKENSHFVSLLFFVKAGFNFYIKNICIGITFFIVILDDCLLILFKGRRLISTIAEKAYFLKRNFIFEGTAGNNRVAAKVDFTDN